MSKILFENSNIEFIDGDRGKNYPKQEDFSDKGHCMFLSAKNVTSCGFNFDNKVFISSEKDNQLKAGKLKRNDIVITTRGTIGNIAIYDDKIPYNDVRINSGMLILRADSNKLDTKFLYYYLSSKEFKEQVNSLISGSAVPQLPIRDIKKLTLPNITKKQQEKIANIISSFEDRIELNTQINQTLEQIAQALFKSWFVDFDPVRAKVQALSGGLSLEQAELAAMQAISGKTPEELTALSQTQPERYAELAETAKAFPCEMVEVDGVEVPRGWEMKALSDLGQIICGKTPSKSNKEFYGDDVPFIKIPDMHNQVFITQTTDNLSVVGANYQSKKYIPAKSICVSCIATVGLVSMTSKPSHTNQQINSIIPDDEQSCEFLYLSLKQPSMAKYLKDLASGGTATFNLNTSTFSKIEIITPSKEIIYIFQKKVVSIFEKTLSNSIENKRLTEIRDLLLPRLLNGEI
ncbi:TPA: restriction endonuclease subunit S [Haemophilus influenzae]|uniref:restriction endonuclease subunit S n=1 Tax=Haemophilus influenzae TaxID=727 RepID=UPI0005AF1466|nr:restriction endonuclease subunit S [Haemophilus influenzae]KIP37474.1 restriction endonuclease HindVIIP subunit S [Haemophilus influenzae]KIP38945.1 restriction endonuclease HindVIIP subunit S [Haemophilus influenzae]KIP46909.1 restriction endonuclease HindVIIP subunit S [Haemophilus influenzae]MCK8903147.1 restriction endonuclease subunit S [Haemophilus influenzae]MCK8976548.1 restriction endonuclease subunit S [Haemophilus influenzae]